MKFLAILLLSTLCLIEAKEKDIEVVRTETYAPTAFHNDENIGTHKFYLGFFIAGYVILVSLLIFAMIRIWMDEIERHRDFDAKLKETVGEMNALRMDVDKIDQDYNMILQGKDPNQEEDPDTVFQQEVK